MLNRDLGIDLGTATTLVYARGRGILFQESSVVATDARSGQVLAVGDTARDMIGRTPESIVAANPVRDGVIADFDLAKAMLTHFIRRARTSRCLKPRVIVGVPSNVTEVERRAVFDAAMQAGCKEAYLIEEPVAAAIGVNLPIGAARGHMIVDIGGGTTDIAILSLGGIVTSLSLKVAGNEMDEAIMQYVKKRHNLLIGPRTAEQVKIAIGSALPPHNGSQTAKVCGLDLGDRMPRCITVNAQEVAEALVEPCRQIVQATRTVIERCPPELLGDIWDGGIVMTGGGALLRGLADLVEKESGLPARVAENALTAVATGTGMALDHMHALKKLIRLRGDA